MKRNVPSKKEHPEGKFYGMLGFVRYLVIKYILLIILTYLSSESNDRVGESMHCSLSFKKYFKGSHQMYSRITIRQFSIPLYYFVICVTIKKQSKANNIFG